MKHILITTALLFSAITALPAQSSNGMKDQMSDGMKDHMAMSAPRHGTLAGVGGHAASGAVTVATDHDKVTVSFDKAFAADGEELDVYLSSDGMKDMGAIKVGHLGKSMGAQKLTATLASDLHAKYLVVWSDKANAIVAKAKLDGSMK